MKIDYKHFICFFLVFMICQYLLVISEWNYYLDMITNIQGYKFNCYKNLDSKFTLKNLILWSFGYFFLTIFIYYYIIFPKKTCIEGFIFMAIMYVLWDLCLFSLFDKAVKHLPVLLYDIFVVGGVCMVISQYIVYNYYDILKNYIPLLFIFYLITMIWFFYEPYKYNPDLSNIKGVVLF
jgi:hypothetical protein